METILDTKQKIERLKEALYNGECTYKEFVRLAAEARKDCTHERRCYYTDDRDTYIWCRDCDEDL